MLVISVSRWNPSGIDHRNKNVLRASYARLKGQVVRRVRRACGEVHRSSRASHVDQSTGVDRDLDVRLGAAATKVGRITQDRVDDEFAGVIVIADGETDSVIRELAKTSNNRLFALRCRRLLRRSLVRRLIDAGSVEAYFSVGR